MINIKRFNITLGLIVLIVYFFVTAPVPLESSSENRVLKTHDVLAIINKLNGVARKLYTNRIVKDGKKVGLKFDENWREDSINAGPLPAQFLRLTSRSLENSKIKLGLYLGSDYPINTANKFKGLQKLKFELLKESGDSQFFFEDDTRRYYYMAKDVAISSACVKCHNDHKDSPKTNWRLNDVMGATTWSYPDKNMDYQEMIEMTSEFYLSVKNTYSTYLDKVNKFQNQRVEVSEGWPNTGFHVPDLKTFMTKYEELAGVVLLQELIRIENIQKGDSL